MFALRTSWSSVLLAFSLSFATVFEARSQVMGAHANLTNPLGGGDGLAFIPPEFSTIELLVDANGTVTQTGGCPIRTLHNPIIDFTSDITLESQTLRFNFVPVQSAIDYLDDVPDDHDIFAETATTVMKHTPFDVIIGEVNGLPGYPQEQEDAQWVPSTYDLDKDPFTYPSLNRPHVTLINHLMPDTFLQNDTNETLFARYLNREIGDEELLLENLNINRPSIFQAEYDIAGGDELNPLYEYPGKSAQDIFLNYSATAFDPNPNPHGYALNGNGIFSASGPFTIMQDGDVEMIAENAPQDLGIVIIGPNPVMTQDTLWVCTNFYADTSFAGEEKRGFDEYDDTSSLGQPNLLVYPNPVAPGSTLYLSERSFDDFNLTLTDAYGKRILKAKKTQSTNNQGIQLPSTLTSGAYFIHLNEAHHSYTFKIIVQ